MLESVFRVRRGRSEATEGETYISQRESTLCGRYVFILYSRLKIIVNYLLGSIDAILATDSHLQKPQGCVLCHPGPQNTWYVSHDSLPQGWCWPQGSQSGDERKSTVPHNFPCSLSLVGFSILKWQLYVFRGNLNTIFLYKVYKLDTIRYHLAIVRASIFIVVTL